MEERYLIIADDFTGANDTGVQLKRRGYPTEVLFAGKPVDSQKSIVIDTESRNALPGHAYEIVRHSLEQVDFGQFCYIIKKVDSTMRGNISQEIKAVDDAFRPDLVVFAPALPALGRTTMDGVQCLNGVEICKTELSKDPKNPLKMNVDLLLEPSAGESVESMVQTIQLLFKPPGQTAAIPLPVVNSQAAACGLNLVYFKGIDLSKKTENSYGEAALEFWECLPVTVQTQAAESRKTSSSGSKAGTSQAQGISTDYQEYLNTQRGQAPRIKDKTSESPARDT